MFWIIGLVAICHASKLQLPVGSDSKAALESSTSPTISFQKKVGSTFYNFVKLDSTVPPNVEIVESTPTPFMFDETRELVFMDDDNEDDEEATSTVTSISEHDAAEMEDGVSATEVSDSPSDTAGDNSPNSPSTDNEPGDGALPSQPEQSPGEAVPGQPGEDTLDSSSSSSSSESDSKSSSSSSEEYREAFKRWEHKVKNELARSNKSKDLLARVYSPLPNSNKIGKIKFSKRL